MELTVLDGERVGIEAARPSDGEAGGGIETTREKDNSGSHGGTLAPPTLHVP